MVDVTGIGQSTEPEAEENDQEQILDEAGEEISDVDAFWEVWNRTGQALLDENDPAELADFLDAAEEAQRVYIDFTVYLSDDEDDSYSLYGEFDIESDADSIPSEDDFEPSEDIDDRESCDCGDSDER